MLGLHRNHLDFEIVPTGNPKTLVFIDSSQYIENPDGPLLQIFLPGMNKYLLTNVVAGQVNTYNSSTLGFSNALQTNELLDLPDGVWEIQYKICPYQYAFITKRHMRVTLLNLKLQRVYDQVSIDGCSCPEQEDIYIQKQLTRIEILIEGAKSVVNIDPEKSAKYYHLANTMVDDILKRFCKHCV